MERMLRENNERMLKAITKQFSQSAVAHREKETFLNQPEAKLKGEISSDFAPESFKKVNATLTLKIGKEINDHVGDTVKEKYDISVDDSGEFKEDEPTVTVTAPPPKISPTLSMPETCSSVPQLIEGEEGL